jgi:TolB-like protein
MVEEITSILSRQRWLFVIARTSAFTYKNKMVDLKQVGRELGVRYLLEGSVRKAGNRVRVAAQLIDARLGTNLWADSFKSKIDDIFEPHDRIAVEVCAAVEPNLRHSMPAKLRHVHHLVRARAVLDFVSIARAETDCK